MESMGTLTGGLLFSHRLGSLELRGLFQKGSIGSKKPRDQKARRRADLRWGGAGQEAGARFWGSFGAHMGVGLA